MILPKHMKAGHREILADINSGVMTSTSLVNDESGSHLPVLLSAPVAVKFNGPRKTEMQLMSSRNAHQVKPLELARSFHVCGQGCNHTKGEGEGDGIGHPDENEEETWASLIHSLVHPGCEGHRGSCSKLGDRGGTGIETTAKSSSDHNFNVDAAMLHIVSDVVRGILMLVLAILIRAGVVNAKRADIISALLVAGLVLIGALSIFQKIFSVAGCLCLGSGRLHVGFFEEKDEFDISVVSQPQAPVVAVIGKNPLS
jgi:hypothetical protein